MTCDDHDYPTATMMNRRLFRPALPLTLSILLLVPAFTGGAEAQQKPFGVNSYGQGSDFDDFDPPSQLQQSIGVQWSRVAINWHSIQPDGQPTHTPTFDYVDDVVDSLTSRGIEVVGVLIGTPKWASPSPNHPYYYQFPPSDLALWETYVRATVDHFKDTIDYWEVWNEPNYDLGWRPAANVNDYFALYQRTWQAIKGPNGVDPDAKLVLGGLSGIDITFLKSLRDLGAWGMIDVVAVHPYERALAPEYFGRVDNLRRLQQFVAENGARPIWYTEVGWPSEPFVSNPPITRQDQAAYLVRDYVQAIVLEADRNAWWNLREDAVDPTNEFYNMGLLQLDMTPKPAFTAFDTMTSKLAGKQFWRRRQPYTPGLVTGFETADTWTMGTWQGSNGSFARTGVVRMSGGASGAWSYSFPSMPAGQGSLLFLQREMPLAGTPRSFHVWVKPDGGDHKLSIEIKDAGDEIFRVKLGFTIGDRWQQMEADLVDAESPFGGDGNIDYPIRFYQFYLENFQIPEFPFIGRRSGTIYLDDVTFDEGEPHVRDYQFTGANGFVDVVWTTDPGTSRPVAFPTNRVTVTKIDGSSTTVTDGGAGDLDGGANGYTTIAVSDSPVFAEWDATGLYVLDAFGTVHSGGAASGDLFNTPYFGWDVAVDLELLASGDGGYVLDGFGGIHSGKSAPQATGAPYFGFHIGRDIELSPDGIGVYLLDGFGGIHAAGGAPALASKTPYFGFDAARDLEFASIGFYVLDGFGGVHAGGAAPPPGGGTPYFGFDIARDLELASTGYYVLDGFGGVHAGGGAATMSPGTPYFGFDIARDVELVGGGYYLLDGFGGLHRGGGAPAIGFPTPYMGSDIAKDLELR